jgi:hypothetical protein
MSFNDNQVEKINFFIKKILSKSLERIFDHAFEIKEIMKNNYHHTGMVGITVITEKLNGEARYNMRSLKFARENETLTQLLELEGIEDIRFTTSKNLLLLYPEDYLSRLIESESFKNLEIGVEKIEKFKL